jgi:hypothetical protein
MKKLSNIKIAQMRKCLMLLGLECKGIKGGHEKWWKIGMTRPIILQTHIEPVPEFIVKNAIKDIGITTEEFIEKL